MGIYYSEILMQDILDTLVTDLNTEITRIQNLKSSLPASAEMPDMETFDTDEEFHFMFLPNMYTRPKWVLVWSEEPGITVMEGSGRAIRHAINVTLHNAKHFTKMPGRHDLLARLYMRYTEAVSATLAKNFALNGGYANIKIEETPLAVLLTEQTEEQLRVANILVAATIGI